MQVFSEKLTKNFEENVALIDRLLQTDRSFDIIKRQTRVAGSDFVMYYIEGFVVSSQILKMMTYLLSVDEKWEPSPDAAEHFARQHIPTSEAELTDLCDTVILKILSGCTAILCSAFEDKAIIVDARSYPARSTEEPEGDRVMRGSRDGFVETLMFNAAMIRRRIRDTNLAIEYLSAGQKSRTDIAVCYIDGLADSKYVEKLKKSISSIKTDSVILGHQSIAESLIRTRWYNPFPKIRTTERPDAASACLLEGSVIVLVDNTPEAMILPTSLFDFLQETDDFYFPPLTGGYLRLLRHFVFFISLLITPLWYLLVSNPQWIPAPLAFIIPSEPGSLPIILQLFLIEFTLDGLKLASLNTPSMLNNSFAIVGGLLLGDFAVKTGWLCTDVILYMAVVSIANFAQPSYELGYAFKFMRMLLLLLSALFGIYGFALGIVIFVILMATNKTINGERKYLYPLIPFNKEAFCRLFFRKLKKIGKEAEPEKH